MPNTETLIFSRSDVERLLTLDECIAAVEEAFAQHAQGKTSPPGVLGMHAEDGGFHIKAALLTLDRPYFGAKTNGNFAQNGARHGLPTIQGVVVLCDASNGFPLAVMDSISITALRTAAATAVAAKYLARKECALALVCGCGTQGAMQLVRCAACASRSAYKRTTRTRAKRPNSQLTCLRNSVFRSPSHRSSARRLPRAIS
jgi:ornithine cyclodeaminase/alanine dehydrogenase